MVILYNKLLELFKVGMQMNDKIKENLLDQSCAPTDNLQSNWDRIDWTKAEQAVKKLQARIVKAQKEGRHNKVKALQWTLTHSFYAKALAVKRVTSNGGGCTPGSGAVCQKRRCFCQFILWYACPCGRIQSYTKESEKCTDDHVLQRGYSVQSLKCTDEKGR
jgi:hypothetical protein